ncbi:MAG TPA: ABC transporter permease [Rhodothermales bacterium]|nr:ABC transporter permease [Rhodothermales bacterium]
MNVLDVFRTATEALRTNKLRSALTLLGMVIGVFAIIASVTAVSVIKVYFEESLNMLGTSAFSIQRYPAVNFGDNRDRDRRPITYEQLERLKERISMPLTISPEEDFTTTKIRYGTEETNPDVPVFGSDENFTANYGFDLKEGRGFTASDVQYARSVVLLGSEIAEDLFVNQTPIGKDVRIDGRRYRVIGVLAAKGSFLGFSWDKRVTAPITTMFNAYGDPHRNIASISIRAEDPHLVPAAIQHVIGRMRVIRKVRPGEENDFEIETNDSVQDAFSAFTGVLTIGGAGIGLISLLAAGVGIMNIMLVSVTERTREIGIRKSLGARRRDITRQFLLEAIFLCQIGGLLGIILGALMGNGLAIYFDISAAFPVGWAIAGVAMVTFVAVVFGGYPAIKAARLNPIESLRYE